MKADYSWETIFSLMNGALAERGTILPSVSEIAKAKRDPFRILISTLISLRTKDAVTLQAAEKLFTRADTPEKMLELSIKDIENAIYPAGFYHTKARRISEIAEILLTRHGGKVPSSQKELLALPGVGLKTANLTLNLGFGIEAVCVDTHVHRIANRMGWIETKTPEESERALSTLLPRTYWIPLNEMLVAYGQKICTPVSPHCSRCPVSAMCPKIGVGKSR
ncbi:MAG: endonuclease III domain-containing protein [Spirochaetota bacterium]